MAWWPRYDTTQLIAAGFFKQSVEENGGKSTREWSGIEVGAKDFGNDCVPEVTRSYMGLRWFCVVSQVRIKLSLPQDAKFPRFSANRTAPPSSNFRKRCRVCASRFLTVTCVRELQRAALCAKSFFFEFLLRVRCPQRPRGQKRCATTTSTAKEQSKKKRHHTLLEKSWRLQ